MLCKYVFQPVIKVIQIAVSIVEFVLKQVCQVIKQFVNVVTQFLEWLCNTIVKTVCSGVCHFFCGICSFFCAIFGCDCHCDQVCDNVCNVVTKVLCSWTWVIKTVLQAITSLICDYILQAFIALLNLIEAVVTLILTFICNIIDIGTKWLLCWTRIADIGDSTDPRRFKVAPKIIPNDHGYSDWFVYVNNQTGDPTGAGAGVDQNVQGYILSDQGRPLVSSVEPESGTIAYYEVETSGDFITGVLKRDGGDNGDLVPGSPFLYYANKVIEIASHLLGDVFASDPSDDGRGTDFHKNLYTYNPNVQEWLALDQSLTANNYNNWPTKLTPGDPAFFGNGSITDMGMRVDTDATCSHPTNTFLNLVNDEIQFTPGNTSAAETMSCGAGQAVAFDDQNFLQLNEDDDASAVTTYLVSRYEADDTSVGCAQWFGNTVVTFRSKGNLLFTNVLVLPFTADTNRMMSKIVENMTSQNQNIVRVAETYLHESGHQCGLVHETSKPDCADGTALNISKLMNPGGNVRRAYTRIQWCVVRSSVYVTSDDLTPFTQAPELPDSGTWPSGPIG